MKLSVRYYKKKYNQTVVHSNITVKTLFVFIMLTSHLLFSGLVWAESSEIETTKTGQAKLTLKPAQCIAIHQGKMCYVDVEITWTMQQSGEYCLFSSQQSKALKCWKKSNQGLFEQEVATNKNVQFQLKRANNSNSLIVRELEVAWVYKKNAKARSSWRMF